MILNRLRRSAGRFAHSLFRSRRLGASANRAPRFASPLPLEFGTERLETRLLLAVDIVEGNDLEHTGDLTWNEDVNVTGNAVARISGNLTIDTNALIQGDGTGADDSLTIFAGGTVTMRGDAMGGGLANLRIFADDSIVGSSDTGAITVEDTTTINIGGTLQLVARKEFDLSFASVNPFFKTREAITEITIGSASLTAGTIIIDASATTAKNIDLEIDENSLASVAGLGDVVTMSGEPILTFADNRDSATAPQPTITRNSGSWFADGFETGMFIDVEGSLENNGSYQIDEVLNSQTIRLVDANELIDEVLDASMSVATVSITEVKSVSPDQMGLLARDAAGNVISSGDFSVQAVHDVLVETFAEPLLDLVGVGAQVVNSNASSRVEIDGANLMAMGDVFIGSSAASDVSINIPSLIAGVAVANSDATAITDVLGSTQINAGGDVSITANVANDMQASVRIYSGSLVPFPTGTGVSRKARLPGPAINVAVGNAVSDSQAIVGSGVTIMGANVTVDADNQNAFEVATRSRIYFPETNMGQAVGVSVSDVMSTAEATVYGDITASGNVNVTSESRNATNDMTAFAIVGNEASRPLFTEFVGPIENRLRQFDLDNRSEPGTLGISAGVGIVDSVNRADAKIAAPANLTALGDLSVIARAEDNFEANVQGGARASTVYSIGGAVSITEYENRAAAAIDDGATTDARGLTKVQADAIIPNQIDLIDLGQHFRSYAAPYPGIQGEGFFEVFSDLYDNAAEFLYRSIDLLVEGVLPFLNSRLGLDDQVATSFVAASAKAGSSKQGNDGKFALSGTVNLMDVQNVAEAWIGEGANVNTNTDFNSDSQSVWVLGTSRIESIHLGGIPGVGNPFSGTKSQGSSLGGTYSNLSLDNIARAHIDDGATVNATGTGSRGDVLVRSITDNLTVNLTDTGGEAHKFGITGTWNDSDFTNTSLAWIEDTATIDAAGDVTVSASNETLGVIFTGSLVSGGRAGVGVTVALGNSTSTTKAFIGDNNTPSSYARGSIAAGDNVSVTATNEERFISVAIAGASAGGTPQPPSEDPLDGLSISNLFADQPDLGGKAGIALSGDVAINNLGTTTHAYIDGVDVTEADNVLVQATSFGLEVSVAGAYAVDSSKTQGGFAIAGSFTWNDLDRNTQAYVNNASITADSLIIDAETEDLLVGVTAGGGGSTRMGTLAVIGSVNLNTVDNTTHAGIWGSSTVEVSDNLQVTALDDLTTITVAGAIAITGRFGFGAAADIGLYNRDVHAWIGAGATVMGTPNEIRVEADANELVVSVAASVGIATKTFGFAGSGAVQHWTTDVQARIDGHVKTNEDIVVDAANDTTLVNVAGAAAGGATAGVGASLAKSKIDRTVLARIGDGATIEAFDIYSDTGNVRITADVNDSYYLFAASGGFGKTAGLAPSLVLNQLDNDVQAVIGAGARVFDTDEESKLGNSVRITADHESYVLSVAGGFAGASTMGFGGAGDVHLIDKNVQAYIDDSAVVKATRDVMVEAKTDDDFLLVAAAAGGGGTIGAQLSAVVVTLDNTTQAWIGDNATVWSDGNVGVAADGVANFISIGGNLGFGGTAGLGLANTTILKTDTTEAWIGAGADVTALGNDALMLIPTNRLTTGGNWSTTQARGLSVTATSTEDFLTVAGGGNAAGTGSVAGAGVVNIIDETTRAWIGAGAMINQQDQALASVDQRVNVLAADYTEILSVAGGLSGAGTGGLGAGADVGTIDKTTVASIGDGAQVRANEHVYLSAQAEEDIFSIAASLGVGGTGGIAGSANVYTIDNSTRALVDDTSIAGGTFIDAAGSVIVDATNESEIDLIAGNISGAGTASLGASAGIALIDRNTRAFLGANVEVAAAQADRGMVMTDSGDAVETRVAAPNATSFSLPTTAANGDPLPSLMSLDREFGVPGAGALDLNGDGADDIDSTPLTTDLQRSFSPAAFDGVSVTASNIDDLDTITANGGGSGTFSVNVSGAVTTTDIDTLASIDSGAIVNSGGSVEVLADTSFEHMAIAAALSLSGVGAVTPGADVLLLENTTTASIRFGAEVNADDDVDVLATTDMYLLTVAAGGGLALQFGLGGAVTYVQVDNITKAHIGEDANVDNAGVTVSAGGNVHVAAQDDTEIFNVTGALGFGVATAGVAGSVSDLIIEKDTQAYIGHRSQVDALGHSDDIMVPIAAVGGAVGEAARRGVVVHAGSTEMIDNFAAAAGGGLIAGLGGGVTIEHIASDTSAWIGANTAINREDRLGASVHQSVTVVALNDVYVTTVGGGIAAGIIGIAGGVDIGVVRNNTAAYIDKFADVYARGHVDVRALAPRTITTVAVSGAFTGLGLTGSVSVWSLGTEFDGTYAFDEFDFVTSDTTTQSENAVPTAGLNSLVDHIERQPAEFATIAGDYNTSDQNGANDAPDNSRQVGLAMHNAGARITAAADTGATGDTLNANPADVNAGTTAFIGRGADIEAAGFVSVSSDNSLTIDAIAGSVQLGGIVIGGAVIITNIDEHTTAYIDQSSTITAGQTAGSDIVVQATYTNNYDAFAIAGQLGGALALGAQVVLFEDTSSQEAYIDAATKIMRADELLVAASAQRIMEFDVSGGGLSLLFAGGASVGLITIGGTTNAFMRDVEIGSNPTQVRNVSVSAQASNVIEVDAIAVGGGLGIGLSGAVIDVVVENTVNASFDKVFGSSIIASGDVLVLAGRVNDIDLNAKGVGAGLIAAAGLVLADVEVNGAAAAVLAGDVQAQNVEVTALADNKVIVDATAGSGAGLAAGAGNRGTARVLGTVDATIGTQSDIDVGGGILVNAYGESEVSVKTKGISVGLGVAVGVSIAQATVAPAITAHVASNSRLHAGGRIRVRAAHNHDENDNKIGHDIRVKANASGGALVGGNGALPTAIFGALVTADVDSGTTLTADDDVEVVALSHAEVFTEASGLTIGLALGVGLSRANTQAGGVVTAQMDGNVISSAGLAGAQNLRVNALGSLIAEADSIASGGGFVGFTGANSRVSAFPAVSAKIGSRQVNVAQDVTLIAEAQTDATATSGGDTGGFASIGNTRANATLTPVVDAAIENSQGTIRAGRNLNVDARHNFIGGEPVDGWGAESSATPTSGGFVGGVFAFSDAATAAQVNTLVRGTLIAGDDINVSSHSSNYANALGDGDAYGAVGLASMEGTAVASGITTTTFNANVQLPNGAAGADNVTVSADGRDFAEADLSAASGGLGAGSGVETRTLASPQVSVNVRGEGGNVSLIRTRGDMNVVSNLEAFADSIALGTSNGGITVGDSEALAYTNIGNGTKLRDTEVIAARDVTIESTTTNGGFAASSGSGKGIVPVSRAKSFVFMTDDRPDELAIFSRRNGATTAEVSGGASINAGRDVEVAARTGNFAANSAFTDTSGLGAGAVTTGLNIVTTETRSKVIEGASITGGSVSVIANPTDRNIVNAGFVAGSLAFSEAGALGTNADAVSQNIINSTGAVDIANSTIVGPKFVRITADHDGMSTTTDAIANSTSGGGDTDAISIQVHNWTSDVDVNSGTQIVTGDLHVSANARSFDIETLATKDGGLIDFGDEIALANIVPNRNIQFDADVTILGTAALEVDAGANVVRAESITINDTDGTTLGPVAADQVVVNPVLSGGTGRALFEAAVTQFDQRLTDQGFAFDADIAGSPTFHIGPATVQITNHSDKDLFLGRVISDGSGGSSPAISTNSPNTGSFNPITGAPVDGGGSIAIENTGAGDVILSGEVNASTVSILSSHNIIGSGNPNAAVVGNNLVLDAGGAIGSASRRLLVQPNENNDDRFPTLTLQAEGDIWAHLQESTAAANRDEPVMLVLVDAITSNSGIVDLIVSGTAGPSAFELFGVSAAGDISIRSLDAPTTQTSVLLAGEISSPDSVVTIELKSHDPSDENANGNFIGAQKDHAIIARDIVLITEAGSIGTASWSPEPSWALSTAFPILVKLPEDALVNASSNFSVSIGSVGGKLRVGEIISSQFISLFARDTENEGDDIVLSADTYLQARDIILNAGDTVVQHEDAEVHARWEFGPGELRFGLEFNDVDDGVGTEFRLNGVYDAARIEISVFGQPFGDENSVYIDRVAAGQPVKVILFGGTNTISIAESTGTLDLIQGDVEILNQTNDATLVVYDDQHQSDAAYTFTDEMISRSGAGTISMPVTPIIPFQPDPDFPTYAFSSVDLFTGQGQNLIQLATRPLESAGGFDEFAGLIRMSVFGSDAGNTYLISDIRTNAFVEVNAGAGADLFLIDGSTLTGFDGFDFVTINADHPTMAPGDELQFFANGLSVLPVGGATLPDGTIQAEDRAAVNFTGIETLTLVTDAQVFGTAATINEDRTDPASGALVVFGGAIDFTSQTDVVGAFGMFSVDSAGAWTYQLDSAAVQSLTNGDLETDTFTITSADGTTTADVVITIQGLNDEATIAGTVTGMTNEDGTALVEGLLTITDIDDGEASVVAQSGVVGTYGTFNIGTNGAWTYDLNNATVQHLRQGESISESFNVHSFDGTATEAITIQITGANDLATINGVLAASLSEDEAQPITGNLTVTDVDRDENRFMPIADLAGSHGLFSIDEFGEWRYEITDSAVQTLPANASFTDTFTITSHDGTAVEQFVITITGENDAATISGQVTGVTNEDNTNLVTGQLTITDIDTGEAEAQPLTDIAGSFGTFSLNANGNWQYQLDTATVQQLNVGDSVQDQFTATSQDGTATETITITINGTNDNPIVTQLSGPGVAAPGQPIEFTGSFSDVDSQSITETWTVRNAAGNVVATGSGAMLNLELGELGEHTVEYSLTDEQGGTASQTLNLLIVRVHQDPDGNVFIGGTNQDDVIYLFEGTRRDPKDSIRIWIKGEGFLPERFVVYETSEISIYGLGGNDRLVARCLHRPLRVNLFGGEGEDILKAGKGENLLDGGDGNDRLWAYQGNDRLYGGEGDDRLVGGKGNDTLDGGAGNDRLLGRGGHDTLIGGEGDDLLKGGAGRDMLYGDAGMDRLFGNAGADYLDGGAGRDLLRGGPGFDSDVFDPEDE